MFPNDHIEVEEYRLAAERSRDLALAEQETKDPVARDRRGHGEGEVGSVMSASIEFGMWRKSSCSAEDANCVEVARGVTLVGVRDSKRPDGPVLVFEPGSWSRLLDQLPG